MAGSSKPRKVLNLGEKVRLIQSFDKSNGKKTVRELASEFGIGKTAAAECLKRRKEISDMFEENADKNRCRKKVKNEFDELDDITWKWFCAARQKDMRISGPLIQEKALEFSSHLGIQNFKASNGWLERFKQRHYIKQFQVSGESADVDPDTVTQWKARLPLLIEGYKLEDVFNTDETGLYYRAMPDKTLAAKGEKNSKERLTVLLCCSSTGEKMKPLVIGKAENPRCFKSLRKDSLPVTWKSNKKAWMTGELFGEFLKDLDKEMRKQKRKILLFVDNATSHKSMNLTNVMLKYFPANTTSSLQPLDQGVICLMKMHYRKQLLKSVISQIDKCESAREIAKSVTVLDAVMWIASAWKSVNPETIGKCFGSSGFKSSIDTDQPREDEQCCYEEGDEELGELLAATNESDLSQEHFITFDDVLETEQPVDGNFEQNLIEEVLAKRDGSADDSSEGEEPQTEDAPGSDMSNHEFLCAVMKVYNYSVAKEPDLLQLASDLKSMAETISFRRSQSLRQATIDKFFK